MTLKVFRLPRLQVPDVSTPYSVPLQEQSLVTNFTNFEQKTRENRNEGTEREIQRHRITLSRVEVVE